MIYATLLTAGLVSLFILGFYTGLWIARHSYRTVEVPKIVTTEKVVEVEKAVIVQVPKPVPTNTGSLAVMGATPRTDVLRPEERREAEHMNDLISGLPEL